MIIHDSNFYKSALDTLYQLNIDEQFRDTCERFIRAEAEMNALNRINSELTAQIIDKEAQIANKEAQIADKEAKIALLQAQLTELHSQK